MSTVPADGLWSRNREQQLQLLGEEFVVVVQVVAEEWERLDEGAAAGHDLGAAAGDQVDVRELLEDAHGVVGGEDADGAREPDSDRLRGDRGKRGGG
jgi:hypothetical protein